MRKFIAEKLFNLAAAVDADMVSALAQARSMKEDWKVVEVDVAPKTRGRPKGRKDSVGPKHEPEVRRVRGRPKGSKNKPKAQS